MFNKVNRDIINITKEREIQFPSGVGMKPAQGDTLPANLLKRR